MLTTSLILSVEIWDLLLCILRLSTSSLAFSNMQVNHQTFLHSKQVRKNWFNYWSLSLSPSSSCLKLYRTRSCSSIRWRVVKRILFTCRSVISIHQTTSQSFGLCYIQNWSIYKRITLEPNLNLQEKIKDRAWQQLGRFNQLITIILRTETFNQKIRNGNQL